jgi:potassium-transporting ATPase potassium-binding subunit
MIEMWTLPIVCIGATVILSIPLGIYLSWIMDGRYRDGAPRWLRKIEDLLDTGAQNWKQYAFALLLVNTLMFVVGYVVLAIQPAAPLNPDGRGMLAPSTIFNSAISFMTNTNLQHYSGDQHLSYFSQIVFVVWNMFLSASVGLCTLAAIIRGLRGDAHMGNFYVDMWRVVVYAFLPTSLLMAVLLMADGVPMTLEGAAKVNTLEVGAMGKADDGTDKPQEIVRGPVAAVMPIKHLGTNGGGYFGANSAHPYENPTAWTNFLEVMNFMVFPFALIVMYGRMLKQIGHAVVVYSVMMTMMIGMVIWCLYWDTMQPNPALTDRAALAYADGRPYQIETRNAEGTITPVPLDIPPNVGLPVDQELGNLEGKELRFGTSAGASFACFTTAIACGSVNCMHDSLNPMAGIAPMTGMWLNCIFGGKGVGMVNMLVYIVVAVFLAGLMVGRTPEYLGKKLEIRETKLAMIALLIHPALILGGTGLFAATDWGRKATNNPAAHGFSEILYEFSSSSANNGSGFEGLGDTYGFANNPTPAPEAVPWDIATGIVMLFGRFVPVIAPLALAASMAAKKPTPFTAGTLRTNTFTFGAFLLGTVLLVGALLFLPAAVLGPMAEHWGPIPFGW